MTQKKHIIIIELTHDEAREYLLKSKSYCNLNLPPYIDFTKLLVKLGKKLQGKDLKTFIKSNSKPAKLDDLNHVIHNNKDGKYAWRPFTLIHPACYVSLVHTITEANKWKEITDRFKLFQANQQLKCFSLPVKSLTKEKDKAEQISHWREEVEQQSIQLALDFGYLFQTDIADCYSSIYTHSIAWALHDKEIAKQNIGDPAFIGNAIDSAIQNFSHRQTNGIPQGSELMDFIAEMVLGYADMQLSEKIKEAQITDYKILRYRDDYKIYVNNPQEGKGILKLLNSVLMDLSLKLNPSKTTETDDLIRGSIKSDKLYWLKQKNRKLNLQDDLLRIHELSQEFPHSGSLDIALYSYLGRIEARINLEVIR
jgi:RNA-directed DNA polymerase